MNWFHLEIFKETVLPYILLVVVCLLYIKFICVNKLVSREYSLSPRKNILILTAHPDDECMFFTPTILNLRNDGHRVYVVCFSKGHYYGHGEVRKKELLASCKQLGITDSHITIIDDSLGLVLKLNSLVGWSEGVVYLTSPGHPTDIGLPLGKACYTCSSKFPDDPTVEWPVEDLGEKILSVTERIKPDSIITFDSWGVSGHTNHKALFHAIRKLSEDGKLSKDFSETKKGRKLNVCIKMDNDWMYPVYQNKGQGSITLGVTSLDISIFTLESTSIIRKYISWLDIPWSCFAHTFPTVFVCTPRQFLRGWKAMSCHESQMVWFRKLYIVFSRYMLVNTLDEMLRSKQMSKYM